MKKFVKPLIVGIMALAGIGLLAYPKVSNMLAVVNQTTAIDGYRKSVEELTQEQRDAEWARAQTYNAALNGITIADPFSGGGDDQDDREYDTLLDQDGVMGYVEIPKIGVRLPILHGTSDEVLERAVGHLEGTSLPVGGAGTHSVLTGHRGLPSAKLFTDLDQVGVGDTFEVFVLGRQLLYTVDEIKVVEPTDTSALKLFPGKDYVTLLTCTPYGINSHRMLVRGVRTDLPPEQQGVEPVPAPDYTPLFAVLGGVGGAGILAGALLLREKRRKRKDHDEER